MATYAAPQTEFPAFPNFITPWARSLLFPDPTSTNSNKRKAENDTFTVLDAIISEQLAKRARVSESSSSIHSSTVAPSSPTTPSAATSVSAVPASPSPSALPASADAAAAQSPALPRRLKGVRQRKWGRWVAEIRCPRTKTRVWLGSYASAEEGVRVYDIAARMIFGEVASKLNLNAPDVIPRPVTVAKGIAESLLKVARVNSAIDTEAADAAAAAVDLSAFRGDTVCLEVVGPNVVVSECPFAPVAVAAVQTESSDVFKTEAAIADATTEKTTVAATPHAPSAPVCARKVDDLCDVMCDSLSPALSFCDAETEALFRRCDSFCDGLAMPESVSVSDSCDLGDFEVLENITSIWEAML